jgi:hypothetical protein
MPFVELTLGPWLKLPDDPLPRVGKDALYRKLLDDDFRCFNLSPLSYASLPAFIVEKSALGEPWSAAPDPSVALQTAFGKSFLSGEIVASSRVGCVERKSMLVLALSRLYGFIFWYWIIGLRLVLIWAVLLVFLAD